MNSHFLKQKSHSARITRQETIHIIIVYGTNQNTKPYYINITLITHNPDSSEQSLTNNQKPRAHSQTIKRHSIIKTHTVVSVYYFITQLIFTTQP